MIEKNEIELKDTINSKESLKKELKKIHSQMCHVPIKRIRANLERAVSGSLKWKTFLTILKTNARLMTADQELEGKEAGDLLQVFQELSELVKVLPWT